LPAEIVSGNTGDKLAEVIGLRAAGGDEPSKLFLRDAPGVSLIDAAQSPTRGDTKRLISFLSATLGEPARC
jgi:hypothetical protein